LLKSSMILSNEPRPGEERILISISRRH
jgi:hypothetical protein